jgi:hypothetical protein
MRGSRIVLLTIALTGACLGSCTIAQSPVERPAQTTGAAAGPVVVLYYTVENATAGELQDLVLFQVGGASYRVPPLAPNRSAEIAFTLDTGLGDVVLRDSDPGSEAGVLGPLHSSLTMAHDSRLSIRGRDAKGPKRQRLVGWVTPLRSGDRTPRSAGYPLYDVSVLQTERSRETTR